MTDSYFVHTNRQYESEVEIERLFEDLGVVAAFSDRERWGEQLSQLDEGDRIISYDQPTGQFLAVGTVDEPWDGSEITDPEKKVAPESDSKEFHVSVQWENWNQPGYGYDKEPVNRALGYSANNAPNYTVHPITSPTEQQIESVYTTIADGGEFNGTTGSNEATEAESADGGAEQEESVRDTPSTRSDLYLAPCSSTYPREHFEDTVLQSLPKSWYSEYTDKDYGDEIRLWATTAGKEGVWKSIEPGDYLTFYFGEEGYRYAARVVDTEHNHDFGVAAWPDYERKAGGSDSSDPYEYVIILEDPFALDLDREVIQDFAGHDIPYIQGFMRLNDEGVAEIRDEWDSIDWFLEAHRPGPNVWIEETTLANKVDREGLRLGESIWSPQAYRNGADKYRTMREPEQGDIVCHVLQKDRGEVVGYSTIVSDLDDDFTVPPDSEWAEPGEEREGYHYVVDDYTELEEPIDLYEQVFGNDRYQDDLSELLDRFSYLPYSPYNDGWRLGEGTYLARSPALFVEILAEQSAELRDGLRDVNYTVPFDQLPFDGEKIVGELLTREANPELYRESLAHLVAGKNLVFNGAPGTGKTRAATRLAERAADDFSIETAHAEWTAYDIVGGYRPTESGSFEPEYGYFAAAASACEDALAEDGQPHWLVVDELNRANLDEAFGEVFTFLDLDYRQHSELTVEDGLSTPVPMGFRVLATMNTYDRAKLFSLGMAFMRRFAFVDVDSLLKPDADEVESIDSPSPADVDYRRGVDDSRETVFEAVVDQLTRQGVVKGDSPLMYQRLATDDEIRKTAASILQGRRLKRAYHTGLDRLLLFAQEASHHDIVELGQALAIDAAKFVVAYRLLFPDTDPEGLVDRAIVAYMMPQFSQYLPELRKESVLGESGPGDAALAELQDVAANLDLPRTQAALVEMEQELSVL